MCAADYSVFVGDLAPDVTDYALQENFRHFFASVRSAKVCTRPLCAERRSMDSTADSNQVARPLFAEWLISESTAGRATCHLSVQPPCMEGLYCNAMPVGKSSCDADALADVVMGSWFLTYSAGRQQ